MWRAFLVVLVMIVLSSIAGRQIYELFPPPVIWALIAGSELAVFVAAAVIYDGSLDPCYGHRLREHAAALGTRGP